jgi:hypothetical protein
LDDADTAPLPSGPRRALLPPVEPENSKYFDGFRSARVTSHADKAAPRQIVLREKM